MSNIKVCVKIHPLSQHDIKLKKEEQWKVTENNSLQCINFEHPCKFTFDHIFGTKSLNYEVYLSVVKPIVESCFIGFNGTILTYGSAFAGKNYTMIGTSMDPGIILITIERLFIKIGGFPHHTIKFGYIEIYKEKMYDLLSDRKQVLIDRNRKFDFMLSNDEVVVDNFEKAVEIMLAGSYKRKSAAEDSSKLSSISHSIFRITIESEDKPNGKMQNSYLRFVHVADCDPMTEIPLPDSLEDESNKSLYWFNVAIDGLSNDEKDINFDNSILTTLLRESLTGKSNSAIVCNVRPDNVEGTVATLKFVSQAKNIRTLPMRNEMYNVRASCSPANDSQTIHLENQLKEIANLKVENFLLHNELEELKAAAAVKQKWFGDQMKSAAFVQRKLEHDLLERKRVENGLELKIRQLINSNEQLLAKLEELREGTSEGGHKPYESMILLKNGNSNLTRENVKIVEKEQLHRVIETGTKRKSDERSESDWSEDSENCKAQKFELNCEKADEEPLPSLEYTTTLNRDRSETCTVTVRNSLVGRLLGLGGSRLNEIRSAAGVSIKVSERNGELDRIVTINGNKSAVSKAAEMVKERLARDD